MNNGDVSGNQVCTIWLMHQSADAKEGVEAFLNRHKPKWIGR